MSKVYIGSGKKHPSYDVVKVTIGWDSASQHVYEKDGKKYLTFDVSAKREPDQYGKTHSCSVWVKDDENTSVHGLTPPPDLKPAPQSESFNEDNIPF